MQRERFIVMVFEHVENHYYEGVVARSSSDSYDDRLDLIKCYEDSDDWKPAQMLITTDEIIFYKARLQAKLLELRSYHSHCESYLKGLIEDHFSSDIVDSTKTMMVEIEKSMMKQVAIRCSSLTFRDIPITDELAIQCCNWRDSTLR